jgi:hypothetical protein
VLSRASATECTLIGIFTLLIFHNPVAKRARHAAKRHNPGEAGVWRLRRRRARECEKFSLLNSSQTLKNSAFHFFFPPYFLNHIKKTN